MEDEKAIRSVVIQDLPEWGFVDRTHMVERGGIHVKRPFAWRRNLEA